MRLYEIDTQLRALMGRLQQESDSETGEIPEELYGEVERLLTAKQVKVLDVVCMWKERRAERDAVKAETKRIAARAASLDIQCDRLEELLNQHIAVGECPRDERAAISWRKSTSVEVTVKPELLPGPFQRWTVEANKTAIGAALKDGLQVEGAALRQRDNMQVR